MNAILTPTSSGDPRLAVYACLRDLDLRKSLESEHGLFMAEGEKIITRAFQQGLVPRSFLLAPRWLDGLRPLIEASGAECFVLPEAEIEQLTGFHVHRGALAAFARPTPFDARDLIAQSSRILVLEDLADHTNIGAIFRTAAALAWDSILLSPRCADPWYRRAVKVSMGAVFSMPFAYVDDWYGFPTLLGEYEFKSFAMTLADDSSPIDDVNFSCHDKIALIVGSEGHGMSSHWQETATDKLIIPMREGVDSLNVAASAAIACWELRSR